MSTLELRGLGKRFAGTRSPAVHDVSLRVERGEVLVVVGGSGSGKTTLLRLIAGLEVPSGGTVRLDDRLLSGPGTLVPPEQRNLGVVFQDYALFPHLSVRRNVEFGLHRMRARLRRERAYEVLDLVGLRDFTDRYPHQLSGGQQQRVALARALAPRPALLLLDEPFSNLDVVLKTDLRDEVALILRGAGATALVVVHDADDALALADRIAILRDGALWQLGAPQDLFASPRDADVARFFGPTNVIPATALGGGQFQTPLGIVRCERARSDPTGCDGCVVSVRPADIHLLDPGVDAGAAGTVRRATFRGRFSEVTVAVATDEGPPLEVVLHLPPGAAPPEGSAVCLRLRPGAAQVL